MTEQKNDCCNCCDRPYLLNLHTRKRVKPEEAPVKEPEDNKVEE